MIRVSEAQERKLCRFCLLPATAASPHGLGGFKLNFGSEHAHEDCLREAREKGAASKFHTIAAEIGALVETKQAAYGNSFGKSGEILKILYPNDIPVEAFRDALAVVRIIDKLFRIATDKDELGESPWRDIAGYALLAESQR